MFNSTPGLDYNKKKRKLPRIEISIVALAAIALLIGGVFYLLLTRDNTDESTKSDDQTTESIAFPLSVRTPNTNATVPYSSGWQTELTSDETFSDVVTLTNEALEAQVIIEFGIDRQNSFGTETTPTDEADLVNIYKSIADAKATELDGVVEQRRKANFDFAEKDNRWLTQLISFKKQNKSLFYLSAHQLSGDSNVTINATYRVSDAKLIDELINGIELDR
jgi:hypothetical protein